MYKEKHTLKKHYGRHKLSRYVDVYETSTINCSASKLTGYAGDNVTVTSTPAWNQKFSGYSITGSTLTGNDFKFVNSDVTVEANYETAKNLTLQTDGHGTIAASRMSGFIGDQVTLSNTPAAHYTFSAYSITGANLTGNNFNFIGNNVTAKALFNLMSYNNVVLTSEYGTITATPNTAVSGETVVLTNTPNDDCSFVNYEVTGATLTGDRYTMPTSNVSSRGVFTRNVHNLTLQTNGNGTLTANGTSGYSGDSITLTPTPNAGFVFNNYNITGATLTGDTFKFNISDVTARANFVEQAHVSAYCFNYTGTYGQQYVASLPFSTRDWPEYGNCVVADSANYVDVKFTINCDTTYGYNTLLISGNNVWKAAALLAAPLRCGGQITEVIPDARKTSIYTAQAFGETYSAIRSYTGQGYAVNLSNAGVHTYQYIFDRTLNMCSSYFDKVYMCSGPITQFTALPLILGVSAITGVNTISLLMSAISVSQFTHANDAYQFLLA